VIFDALTEGFEPSSPWKGRAVVQAIQYGSPDIAVRLLHMGPPLSLFEKTQARDTVATYPYDNPAMVLHLFD
jgi:hypothetical protein